MSRILPDHNEHGVFEGHEKVDITSKVLDSPFTNLIQRSDSNEKPMLLDDFLVAELPIKRWITAL